MKLSLPLLLLFLLARAAAGQPRLVSIYHLVSADGSVAVWGENHGFAPFTVSFSAELVNMHSTSSLPANLVVYPAAAPCLLATFIPDRQPCSFRYKSPYQLGVYTGLAPDTSYVYGLPFRPATGAALPPCSTANTTVPGNRYPCFFALPAGAPICAARAGVVAALRQDVAHTTGAQANYIIVYHEDGGVAWYQNLQKNAAAVTLGQRVTAGDTLGYLSREQQHPPLYFDVQYPGEQHPQAVPVTFRVGNRLWRPHQR